MKKLLLTIIGAVILSQNIVQIANSRPIIITALCIDRYKYLTTAYGYAAVDTVQMFEQGNNRETYPLMPPQPATCKER